MFSFLGTEKAELVLGITAMRVRGGNESMMSTLSRIELLAN